MASVSAGRSDFLTIFQVKTSATDPVIEKMTIVVTKLVEVLIPSGLLEFSEVNIE